MPADLITFFTQLACGIAYAASSIAVPFAEIDPAAKRAVEIARHVLEACAGLT